jgi:hypothetical protein
MATSSSPTNSCPHLARDFRILAFSPDNPDTVKFFLAWLFGVSAEQRNPSPTNTSPIIRSLRPTNRLQTPWHPLRTQSTLPHHTSLRPLHLTHRFLLPTISLVRAARTLMLYLTTSRTLQEADRALYRIHQRPLHRHLQRGFHRTLWHTMPVRLRHRPRRLCGRTLRRPARSGFLPCIHPPVRNTRSHFSVGMGHVSHRSPLSMRRHPAAP